MEGCIITVENARGWITTWTHTNNEWVGKDKDGSEVKGISLEQIIGKSTH